MARYRRVPRREPVADLRQAAGNDTPAAVADEAADEPVPYRDLQARAKEAGIPANQSREDLEAALGDSA